MPVFDSGDGSDDFGRISDLVDVLLSDVLEDQLQFKSKDNGFSHDQVCDAKS